jgi:hypothetical protein
VAAARIRNVRVAKVSTGPDVAQTPQIAATNFKTHHTQFGQVTGLLLLTA